MPEEKIDTLHPAGKKGVRISLKKYVAIRKEIFAVLAEGPLTFMKMANAIEQRIGDSFEGSVGCCSVAVKQDLEARGILQTVPHTKPSKLVIRNLNPTKCSIPDAIWVRMRNVLSSQQSTQNQGTEQQLDTQGSGQGGMGVVGSVP